MRRADVRALMAAARQAGLSHAATDVLTYVALCSNDRGTAWPSWAQVQAELDLSEDTVRRALNTAEAAGLVAVDHRRRGGNRYRFTTTPSPVQAVPNPAANPAPERPANPAPARGLPRTSATYYPAGVRGGSVSEERERSDAGAGASLWTNHDPPVVVPHQYPCLCDDCLGAILRKSAGGGP